MMSSIARRLAPLGVSALVVLAVSACGSGASSSTVPATLTIYNGQHEQTTEALVQAFEHRTGITVNVRSDDESALANQIVLEGSHSPADIFYSENSPALEFLGERGLLAPTDSSTLAAVAKQYNSPRGDWVGVSARSSVIVYNIDRVKAADIPTSVMDLADPRWKGLLGIAPGETDFQPIVTSVARAHGDAAAVTWLKALKDNAGDHVYPDNETLTAQVNSGQIAIALINHYYWYRQRDESGAANMHSQIAYFQPHDPGYVIDVSGAGVLASSHNQVAAQQFLAFMVSAAGEEIIAHDDSYEYPLGSGVATARALKPFNTLQPSPVTIAELGDGAGAITLLQRAQLL